MLVAEDGWEVIGGGVASVRIAVPFLHVDLSLFFLRGPSPSKESAGAGGQLGRAVGGA
jgi:hypothetical protein